MDASSRKPRRARPRRHVHRSRLRRRRPALPRGGHGRRAAHAPPRGHAHVAARGHARGSFRWWRHAVGGVAEIVEDGRTGLLVPPGDEAALAAAIARLLDDEPLRRRLGSAARRQVADPVWHRRHGRMRTRAVVAPRVVHVTTAAASLRYLLLNQMAVDPRTQGTRSPGVSSAGPDAGSLTEHGIPHAGVPMTRRLTPFGRPRSLWQLYRSVAPPPPDHRPHAHPEAGPARPAGRAMRRRPGGGEHAPRLLLPRPHAGPAAPLLRRDGEDRRALLGPHPFQNDEDGETALREASRRRARIRLLGNGIDLGASTRPPSSRRRDGERARPRHRRTTHPSSASWAGWSREKGLPELLERDDGSWPTRFPASGCCSSAAPTTRRPTIVTADRCGVLGLEDVCVFAGIGRTCPAVYAAMDVFTLPSHREGFPARRWRRPRWACRAS